MTTPGVTRENNLSFFRALSLRVANHEDSLNSNLIADSLRKKLSVRVSISMYQKQPASLCTEFKVEEERESICCYLQPMVASRNEVFLQVDFFEDDVPKRNTQRYVMP